jgi:hypothetical protein
MSLFYPNAFLMPIYASCVVCQNCGLFCKTKVAIRFWSEFHVSAGAFRSSGRLDRRAFPVFFQRWMVERQRFQSVNKLFQEKRPAAIRRMVWRVTLNRGRNEGGGLEKVFLHGLHRSRWIASLPLGSSWPERGMFRVRVPCLMQPPLAQWMHVRSSRSLSSGESSCAALQRLKMLDKISSRWFSILDLREFFRKKSIGGSFFFPEGE